MEKAHKGHIGFHRVKTLVISENIKVLHNLKQIIYNYIVINGRREVTLFSSMDRVLTETNIQFIDVTNVEVGEQENSADTYWHYISINGKKELILFTDGKDLTDAVDETALRIDRVCVEEEAPF